MKSKTIFTLRYVLDERNNVVVDYDNVKKKCLTISPLGEAKDVSCWEWDAFGDFGDTLCRFSIKT